MDTIKKWHASLLIMTQQKTFIFRDKEPGKQPLVFDGSIKNDSVRITLKRFDVDKFTLVNRGYNCINEYPYNR